MDPKNITLNGGIHVSITLENGTLENVLVRQLKLREWKHALPKMDDEFDLVGFCCGKSKQQLEEVTPESYDALHAAMNQANAKGFFTFAARQVERAAENLRGLPPELVEKLLKGQSTSSMRSPHIPPPQG